MVKLLATADWQLDMRAHKLSKHAKEMLYDARLKALDSLLKMGKEHGVEAILAAGDLFEVPNPRKSLVEGVHESSTQTIQLMFTLFPAITTCANQEAFGLNQS